MWIRHNRGVAPKCRAIERPGAHAQGVDRSYDSGMSFQSIQGKHRFLGWPQHALDCPLKMVPWYRKAANAGRLGAIVDLDGSALECQAAGSNLFRGRTYDD